MVIRYLSHRFDRFAWESAFTGVETAPLGNPTSAFESTSSIFSLTNLQFTSMVTLRLLSCSTGTPRVTSHGCSPTATPCCLNLQASSPQNAS